METYIPENPTRYNREKGKIYLGIPSGSLEAQTLRLCQEVGLLNEQPGRIYQFQALFNDIIFRVLDRKELAEEVEMGIVDAGITGKDYIREFGNPEELEVIESDLIFSKKSTQPSRLVMVSDPKKIDDIERTKGARIFTEMPKLTTQMLQECFGFEGADLANINLSRGKTEQKLRTGRADAVADITETGTTIKENGFVELGTLFESNPQLIANKDSIKDKAVLQVIEDFGASLKSILDAERNPMVTAIMNVPKKLLEKVLKGLPTNTSPTIAPLQDNEWVSVTTVIPDKDYFKIAPRLKRLGATGIIKTPVQAIY